MMVKIPITEADAIRALACKVNILCSLIVLGELCKPAYNFSWCKICACLHTIFLPFLEANDVS